MKEKDILSIPFSAGADEETIEQAAKEKENSDNEANKAMKAASDIIDHINEFEVKVLKEKLILNEDDDDIDDEAIEEDENVLVNYTPSDEALPIYNKIKDANKLDDLNELIKSIYPEGLDNKALDDILTEESDWILKNIQFEESINKLAKSDDRLFLSEDIDNQDIIDNIYDSKAFDCLSLLSDAINDEYNTITKYSGIIGFINNDPSRKEVVDIINGIIADEYSHIGLLQKAMEIVNPTIESAIEAGKEEAENTQEIEAK